MTEQPTTTMPASIDVWDSEKRLADPDLDLDYIDEVACDVAEILRPPGGPCVAEFVYQPNDGTRYPLVIVPLVVMHHTVVTRMPGWELHAVSGMASREREGDRVLAAEFYEPNGYLVNWVEHATYPLRLGNRSRDLAASYVADHWNTTDGSGCSLAILFRAISHHLDRLLQR